MAFDIILITGAMVGGTVSAFAQVDIPQDGTIVGVQWSVHFDLDADAEIGQVFLSFAATAAIANDSRSVISTVVTRASVLTAVGAVPNYVNFHVPMELDVSGGERIFLHEISTAGVTGSAACLVHFASGGRSARSPRRRT